MNKLIMCQGLPASGKSTWTRQFIKENPEFIRVNKDDLRAMLHNGKFTKGNEKQILRLRDAIVQDALENGKSVIIDDTNLHPKHEVRLRDIAGMYGIRFEIRFFDVSVAEAVRRDSLRSNSVGRKAIYNMYRQYLRPIPELIAYDDLPMCLIFDLDGTLALMTDRNPYDGQACATDIPNVPVVDILRTYSRNDKIFIFSGRNGDSEPETRDWLEKHGIPFDTLHMRKIGDQRSDVVVKQEMFDTYIKNKYNVRFVVDDRLSVCRLWHSLGLTILRVGDPDAEF